MRRVMPLLLVLALLSGWQQALLHPLVHADSHGTLVHLPTPSGDDHGDPSADCEVLAALASCISGAIAPIPQPARPVVMFSMPVAAPAPSTATVAYLSQAPPLFS